MYIRLYSRFNIQKIENTLYKMSHLFLVSPIHCRIRKKKAKIKINCIDAA